MPIDPAPLPPDLVPLSKLPNFDPRTVPVVAIDSHLPTVAGERLRPDALRERFRSPPPWEPEVRAEPRFTHRAPADASVLVPIVLRERPTVLLTERTTHLSTHSGQIAFPGGKRDATDTDAAHTALREAHEEIGLEASWVEVLGQMGPYTTGTGFIVTPVIGLVHPDAPLALNPYEVADAFEVPLAFLMNPAHHRRHAIEAQGVQREWFSMPYMDGAQERYIWGVTAAILRNFYRFLAA
jgi:8-oxo-dGTP pyrophosphatase MutT (NUDIX family)